MGRLLAWTSALLLFVVAGGTWWVVKVYAPPPTIDWVFSELPQPAQNRAHLNYEWAGSLREQYAGVLSFRNTGKYAWTNVHVEIWVYAQPGSRNFRFTCMVESTV